MWLNFHSYGNHQVSEDLHARSLSQFHGLNRLGGAPRGDSETWAPPHLGAVMVRLCSAQLQLPEQEDPCQGLKYCACTPHRVTPIVPHLEAGPGDPMLLPQAVNVTDVTQPDSQGQRGFLLPGAAISRGYLPCKLLRGLEDPVKHGTLRCLLNS